MARPRKYHKAKRSKSGRLSQAHADVAARTAEQSAREMQDTMCIAIDYRQRVLAVPASEVRNQKAGSFAGRLCLSGAITETQYEALMVYHEAVRDYHAAIDCPKGDIAFDPNRVPGFAGADREAWALRAIARYRQLSDAVQDRQNELRGTANLFAALYECVQRDQPWERMVGDLREAANAIARRLRMMEKQAA